MTRQLFKLCCVEVEEVAVAIGPPPGCEVITEAARCPLLAVRPDPGPDRHSSTDTIVEVRLRPAPIGLKKAVSTIPRDQHRFDPRSDRTRQLRKGGPTAPEVGVFTQVIARQPKPIRVTGIAREHHPRDGRHAASHAGQQPDPASDRRWPAPSPPQRTDPRTEGAPQIMSGTALRQRAAANASAPTVPPR